MFKTLISTTMDLYLWRFFFFLVFVQIYLNKYIYETFLSSNKTKKVGSENTTSKPRPKGNNSGGFLPPPPGGMKLPPPPGGALPQTFSTPPSGNVSQSQSQSQVNKNSGSNVDLLDFDFGAPDNSSNSNTSAPSQPVQGTTDPWGDFTGAG